MPDKRHFLFWILLVLAACGGEDRTVVIDRVHDLVALIEEAEVGEGSPYFNRPMAEIQARDNRDGLAYLRATPGAPIVFKDLYTRGRAVLEFGCGVAHVDEKKPPSGKARFRIEVQGEEVFDVTLSPEDLPDDTRYRMYRKELAAEGEEEWTLRFTCESEGEAEWCGWISPRLVSDGRAVGLDDHPVDLRTIRTDLIEHFGDAEGSVVVADVNTWKDNPILGGSRKALKAIGASRIRYSVSPQPGQSLEFSVGLDSLEGWSRPGDGMTFAVEVDGARVWSQLLDPHGEFKHRGWHASSIDLGPWAGATVRLELVTEPGGDAANDVGGWSDVAVIERRSVPRLTSEEAPTILFVVVETLRADFIGAYGCERGLTPRLDAMAKESVFFSDARSVSSWTWPSVASMLTGLYPNSHGIKDRQYCFLVDRIETIAELFADRGYTTGAFLSNMLISKDNNFHQGFETFVLTPNATARALNERVKNWLDNTQGLARFAFIHYYDPHSPYKPPDAFCPVADPEEMDLFEGKIQTKLLRMEESGRLNPTAVRRFVEVYRKYYGAEIAYFDTAFGEFMEAIERRGLLENGIVLFTSDHGEEFMEHGFTDHGAQLFDETLKVPLWISGYGKAKTEPAVVSYPVETKDIFFTLCELADIPMPRSQAFGKPLLRGGPKSLFSQTLLGWDRDIKRETEMQAVVQGKWKLIHVPEVDRTMLFDLEFDPVEKKDQSETNTEKRESLMKILNAWEKSTNALAPDSRIGDKAEMEERLKALGYIGD